MYAHSSLAHDHNGCPSKVPPVCGLIAALLIVLCGGMFAGAAGQSPSVTKVEPPSLWANHTINPVRFLIRGTNLRDARLRATRPQTTVSKVKVNHQGTYVFADVLISQSAEPG